MDTKEKLSILWDKIPFWGLLCVFFVAVFFISQPSTTSEERPDRPEDTGILGVEKAVMEEDGVVCYIFDQGNGGGISCLPVNQTEVAQ
jgi:hypothetical protein